MLSSCAGQSHHGEEVGVWRIWYSVQSRSGGHRHEWKHDYQGCHCQKGRPGDKNANMRPHVVWLSVWRVSECVAFFIPVQAVCLHIQVKDYPEGKL